MIAQFVLGQCNDDVQFDAGQWADGARRGGV